MTSNEAWDTIQAAFARIDAAPGPRRRRRKTAEEEAAEFERVPDPPDLSFEFDEAPPAWTLQGGRRARVVHGKPMLYLLARVKKAQAQLVAKFRQRIPAGWRPKEGPVRVEVLKVFPLRRGEKVPDGDALVPHVERPDLTNLWKGEEDAMARALVAAGAMFDDSQIYDLHLQKYRGRRPRWTVRLWWERGAGQMQFDV